MFVQDGWLSPRSVFEDFHAQELARRTEAEDPTGELAFRATEEAMAAFLGRLTSAAVLLPDGRTVIVDRHFLGQVTSAQPFRHRLFDLETGLIGANAAVGTCRTLLRRLRQRRMAARGPRALLRGRAGALRLAALVLTLAGFIFGSPFLRLFIALVIALFVVLPFLLTLLLPLALLLLERCYGAIACRGYEGGRLMIAPRAVQLFKQLRYDMPKVLSEPPRGEPMLAPALLQQLVDAEERCAIAMVAAHDAARAEGRRLRREAAQARFGAALPSPRAFRRAWQLACRMRPEMARSSA